jgi:hypothetical protein
MHGFKHFLRQRTDAVIDGGDLDGFPAKHRISIGYDR